MNAVLFHLKCLTNLHVGSGESNFSLIDNEVEKDSILGQPVIYASGVKGALRDYYKQRQKGNEDMIFGSETGDAGKSKPGNIKFLEASLLARPMRASMGESAYYLVTSIKILLRYFDLYQKLKVVEDSNKCEQLISQLKSLSIEQNYKLIDSPIGVEGLLIENVMDKAPELEKFLLEQFGTNIVIMSDKNLKEISLPIVARNKLENGESKHLWYEEIVPHESLFYFYVLSNNGEEERDNLKELEKVINEQVIQFGGNATIGYGLSYVIKVGEYFE